MQLNSYRIPIVEVADGITLSRAVRISVSGILEAFPSGASGSKSVVLEGEAEIETLETFQQGCRILRGLGLAGVTEYGGLEGLEFLVPDVLPATGAGE